MCGADEHRIRVGVGQMFVGRAPKVISTILGSCVAVMMHDPETKLGALAHVMLDRCNDREGLPSKFADTAVPELLRQMRIKGAQQKRIVSKIVGGAVMFNFKDSHTFANIGAKNIEVVKESLKLESIPILAEDVGGRQGRSVEFSCVTGEVSIRVNGVVGKVL